MEERHDEQVRRPGAPCVARPCPCARSRSRRGSEVLQVRQRLAVRDRRALGLAGGPRRVEDREEVVLVDRRRRAARPGSSGASRSMRRPRRAVRPRRGRSRRRARASSMSSTTSRTIVPPLRIAERAPSRRSRASANSSSSAFHQALSGTHGRAHHRAGPEHHDPLDVVRGEDRDAVAAARPRARRAPRSTLRTSALCSP